MWLHNPSILPLLLSPASFNWSSLPVFIKIIFSISILALCGILIAILHITRFRNETKESDKKTVLLKAEINQLLMKAVVMVSPDQKIGQPVKTEFNTQPFLSLGITDKEVSKILVAEMIAFRNYFSGQIAENIRGLYISLSLPTQALTRLSKKKWETKVNALAELFKMDIEIEQDLLISLVKNKNRYIREFARLSLIKYSKDDPLKFLLELNEPISPWEEIEMFLLFQQKTGLSATSLQGLLSVDKEPTLVSLALKLAVFFKQTTTVPHIRELIKTPDLKLRGEAIDALSRLEETGLDHFLMGIYPHQPLIIKLEILKGLGRMKTGHYLDFLENELTNGTDFEIKKQASDALIKQYPLSERTIEKLMSNSGQLQQRILSHSLNPLINAQ